MTPGVWFLPRFNYWDQQGFWTCSCLCNFRASEFTFKHKGVCCGTKTSAFVHTNRLQSNCSISVDSAKPRSNSDHSYPSCCNHHACNRVGISEHIYKYVLFIFTRYITRLADWVAFYWHLLFIHFSLMMQSIILQFCILWIVYSEQFLYLELFAQEY